MSWLVREVGAAIERLTVRGQEDAHRPAAGPGHGLHGVHVDGIEVRSLLAIDLDGHEAGIELGSRGLVLERLALHDVAPMAGGIADGQEDGRAVSLARRSASSPHGYQSTGLCACWSRYGLVSSARRLV